MSTQATTSAPKSQIANQSSSSALVSSDKALKPKKEKKKAEKKMIKRDVATVLNKNALQRKMLVGMNPYLQTLLDPFNIGGVRIPDMNIYPSGTFQIVDRRTLTVNSSGVCAIAYGFYTVASSAAQGGSLTPVNISGSGSQPYCVGMTSVAATASTSDLFNGASPVFLSGWGSNADIVPSFYTKARLVSAGLVVQYLGAPLNAKGKMSFAFAPRNALRTYSQSGLSVSRLLSVPGARIVPVNTLMSPMVLYQPQDGVSLEYVDLTSTSVATNSSVWDTDANLRAAVGGEMVVALDGCVAADTVQCTLVLNYEGIPRTNALNIVSTQQSPNDPISLNHAFNFIQDAPKAIATTSVDASNSTGSATLSSSASPVVVPHPYTSTPEPVQSGMNSTENKQQSSNPTGMFDSVLSGIGDFMSDLPSYIEKATPLIEGLMAML